ncbi:MAG: winged helix-turn-helix transcriptional regulator [Parahaliea sp.]
MKRLCEPGRDGERPVKGLNFFHRDEQRLLRALERPEFNIHGLRRADLKAFLPGLSDAALSRQLRRLRCMGLIKRVAHSYRYYLTRLGRAAIAAACSLTQFNIVPALAAAR